MSIDPDTIAFYQARAPHYVLRFGESHSHQLDAFLDRLAQGGAVLELGCGSGRDAVQIKERGFSVDATDATPAMVAKANERWNLDARVMAFHELEAEAAYAGVWAHASLLHCPRDALVDVLRRIERALTPGGWFFASYKLGQEAGRDSFGRFYNFPDAEWLCAQYGLIPDWRIVTTAKYPAGGFDNVERDWIDIIASKP
jgi:SAM-dependent methyltransferase